MIPTCCHGEVVACDWCGEVTGSALCHGLAFDSVPSSTWGAVAGWGSLSSINLIGVGCWGLGEELAHLHDVTPAPSWRKVTNIIRIFEHFSATWLVYWRFFSPLRSKVPFSDVISLGLYKCDRLKGDPYSTYDRRGRGEVVQISMKAYLGGGGRLFPYILFKAKKGPSLLG